MKQDFKKKLGEQEEGPLEKEKQKFDQIKKKATTRAVTLITDACCGCGCYDIEIKRKVSSDSPLKDGDRVTHIEDGDEIVG